MHRQFSPVWNIRLYLRKKPNNLLERREEKEHVLYQMWKRN